MGETVRAVVVPAAGRRLTSQRSLRSPGTGWRTTSALSRSRWSPQCPATQREDPQAPAAVEFHVLTQLWHFRRNRAGAQHDTTQTAKDEPTFRFIKSRLGWNKPLRAAAADRWTWLIIACYAQLYLAEGKGWPVSADSPWSARTSTRPARAVPCPRNWVTGGVAG